MSTSKGPNQKAAEEKYVGKLIDLAPDAIAHAGWNRAEHLRGFDRFMATEVIAYDDNDDDLVVCVCASVEGIGTAVAGFFNIEDIKLAEVRRAA